MLLNWFQLMVTLLKVFRSGSPFPSLRALRTHWKCATCPSTPQAGCVGNLYPGFPTQWTIQLAKTDTGNPLSVKGCIDFGRDLPMECHNKKNSEDHPFLRFPCFFLLFHFVSFSSLFYSGLLEEIKFALGICLNESPVEWAVSQVHLPFCFPITFVYIGI